MVTDDERDYMYTEYAKDPRMKANIGIRRRLAPLLDNDRNQLELFTALLLSLPGSPVLYYGDEIGMGDNIWAGDRDGVRTPMQWTPDRNGGFSTCDPQRLYLQTLTDPIYGYQAINVEAQQRNPGSLLHWTKRMIEIRKRHPVFGLGGYEELNSSNPSVLAFVREHPEAGDPTHRTGRPDPVRQQPVPFPAASRAGPAAVQGDHPGRMHGRGYLPADRGAALSAHPARPRFLLVPAARVAGGRPVVSRATVQRAVHPGWPGRVRPPALGRKVPRGALTAESTG
jgi:hypothetical protein